MFHTHVIVFIIYLSVAVRRRRVGNVPHRESKTLLHGHEKIGPEETAESDQASGQPIHGDFLRLVEFQEVLCAYKYEKKKQNEL